MQLTFFKHKNERLLNKLNLFDFLFHLLHCWLFEPTTSTRQIPFVRQTTGYSEVQYYGSNIN